jgi:hypothetical protein
MYTCIHPRRGIAQRQGISSLPASARNHRPALHETRWPIDHDQLARARSRALGCKKVHHVFCFSFVLAVEPMREARKGGRVKKRARNIVRARRSRLRTALHHLISCTSPSATTPMRIRLGRWDDRRARDGLPHRSSGRGWFGMETGPVHRVRAREASRSFQCCVNRCARNYRRGGARDSRCVMLGGAPRT